MLLASFAGGEAEEAVRTAVRKGVRPVSELVLNECTNCLSKVVAADKFSDVGPLLMVLRVLLPLLALLVEELVGEALTKLEERFRLPII